MRRIVVAIAVSGGLLCAEDLALAEPLGESMGDATTAVGMAKKAVDAPTSLIPTFSASAEGDGRLIAFLGSGSTLTPDVVYGARNALAYKVEPIVLAGGHARIQFHDRKGWELFGLRAGYETDRAYRSGGTISDAGGLARELGVRGVAADVIDFAVKTYGLGVEGELATFTNGRVQVQDVASGKPYADAPLQFSRRRVETTLDLSRLFAAEDPLSILEVDRSAWIARAVYYEVTLPRIAYLTEIDGANRETVVAESSPQRIRVALGAVGASFRWSMLSGPMGRLGSEVTAMVGGGNVQFTMPARLGEPESATNRVALTEPTLALVTRLTVRGEFRLTRTDLAVWLGGTIAGEQYYAQAAVPGSTSGSVGFADAFLSATVFARLRYDRLE